MLKWCVILLMGLPVLCFSQYTISGKVVNKADKKPVANASVFFNNAVAGSKTADDGVYAITNVRPGQYDLVVSVVGYEPHHQNIIISKDTVLAQMEILPKTIVLNEVKIKPNNNWDRDYQTFKRLFLGTTDNAAQCKILNPDQLDLDNDPAKGIFKARSYDFLEIENSALGYKIRYLLTELINDNKAGVLYYEGSASFEELKGSAGQKRRWAKARQKAYEGSSMHFLRSAISNNLDVEGFKVLRLIRTPNPDFKGFGAKYKESLVNVPLTVNEYVKPTDVKGLFALNFNDCLYIMYKKTGGIKPGVRAATTEIATPDYLEDPLTTVVIFDETYAFFDFNGIIANPRSVTFEGAWTRGLLAELLPVDYYPPGK